MALFGGKTGSAGAHSGAARLSRHSSGWVHLLKYLRARESLRILDIGPTSAGNINFITALGHSVYMANLVEDAARPEYLVPDPADPSRQIYDTARFLTDNLAFAGRNFDVVTLWDTADYLPPTLVGPVIDRIFDVMQPGGQLLSLFHSKPTGDDTVFSRYHLTDTDLLEMQRIGNHPVSGIFTNRQIETLFQRFAGTKFFLAKDTLREVIVNR